MYKIEVFCNKRGKWQWRLKAGNNKILAHSEEYSGKPSTSRYNAIGSAENFTQDMNAGRPLRHRVVEVMVLEGRENAL